MAELGNSDEQENGQEPLLLDTRDAAKLLAIGERTLWRWSRSGIAPAPIKIGRGLRAAVRYRRAELLEWIADGCPRTDRKRKWPRGPICWTDA